MEQWISEDDWNRNISLFYTLYKTTVQIIPITTIQLYNYRAIQQYNYIKMKNNKITCVIHQRDRFENIRWTKGP